MQLSLSMEHWQMLSIWLLHKYVSLGSIECSLE